MSKYVNYQYIIREVKYDCRDSENYFDDDFLRGCEGNGLSALYIVNYDRWGNRYGFQSELFDNIANEADNITEAFERVEPKSKDPYSYGSYKEAMIEYGIKYTPRTCHLLKEWAEKAYHDSVEGIAEYMTITTGHKWSVCPVRGYCQGDFCEVVFCEDYYTKEDAKKYGEVYLGCYKEFCVIELDDNGEETDFRVYGFIVADCEAWEDEEYKKIVCDWYGCSVDEARLEMIDGYNTYTTCTYRTA